MLTRLIVNGLKCLKWKGQTSSWRGSWLQAILSVPVIITLCLGQWAYAELPSAASDLDNKAETQVAISISQAMVRSNSKSGRFSAIVSGVYPNGCYRWASAHVESNLVTKTHEIKALAHVSQGMCIMVLVPFTQEIDLGILSPGQHTLRFVAGDGTYFEQSLKVD